MAAEIPGSRCHLALATISGAVIAYQLALMQILSLVQWHHFASLIIAVALLGFGAAGTCLALLRPWLMRRFAQLLPLVLCLSGAAMAVMPGLAQDPWARFDSLLVFTGTRQILRLLLTCGLYFLPVFLAALAIGMIFVRASRDIGRLYFWNLAGSGLGGAALTGLMWLFPPAMLPGLAALAAVAAAVVVLPQGLRRHFPPRTGGGGPALPARPEESAAGRRPGAPGRDPGRGLRWVLVGAALLSLLIAAASLIRPPVPVLSEFKGLRRALILPGARITHERTSPYGLMQVFTSPALRYAPGLSLTWQERLPAQAAVFNNGDWFGAIVPRQEQGQQAFMDHTTAALPYALGDRKRVLFLDAGTGSLIPQALGHGAERITAVEPHPVILSILKGELAAETGEILRHPAVSVHNLSARTFLALDSSTYDLIVLPTVDAFGGTSGLQAVTERYLLTREAFRQMWRKLTPDGAISITCWMDYPLRHPLKILATLAEVLESEGAGEIRDHLAAVRGWGTITILAKKGRLDGADGEKIRRFCSRLLFDPALLPDVRPEERARFNSLQDGRFFFSLDQLISTSRVRFIADYSFDIRPATDDRPYFSQFLRWRSIPELVKLYGGRAFPFLEAGYLLVLLTLLLLSIASAVLILLPLGFLRRRGGCRISTLIYFSGLGIGYMFVEIVLIQRFLLIFGSPIQAAAVVISGMLVFSGVGSLLSKDRIGNGKRALALFSLLILTILGHALLLSPLLRATVALPPAARIVLSLLIIAPAALLMGMPFPLGIRLLAGTGEQEIPWAWGINGCLSVVGSVLATVIAVELGFAWVMYLAALAYAMALWAGWVGLFRPEAFRSGS
jgi:hypothetical protein